MQHNPKTLLQATALMLFSCLSCTVAFCQSKETFVKKIYLEAAAGACNQNGISAELGVQAVLKNNWTATFSYHSIEMNPKNLPANYTPGYTMILIFPISDEYPNLNMNLYSFTGGKSFEAGRRIWFTTEAGISVISGEQMTFTPQALVQDSWHSSANYSVKKENTTTIGAMVKADFNWAFCQYMGLGAGVFANFSSLQIPVGFQLKLTCGWMNIKRKH